MLSVVTELRDEPLESVAGEQLGHERMRVAAASASGSFGLDRRESGQSGVERHRHGPRSSAPTTKPTSTLPGSPPIPTRRPPRMETPAAAREFAQSNPPATHRSRVGLIQVQQEGGLSHG